MLHLICALKAEATPLIEHYKLKRIDSNIKTLSPVYTNQESTVSLTLSGIGKLNAGCAVIETYHLFEKSRFDMWLNIGVAGHGECNIGDLVIANKIIDALSGKSFYPVFIFKHDLKASELHCFDYPSNDYSNVAIDMESCGFYAIASKIGTLELIHCLKVISDNSEESLAGINAKKVNKLITKNLDAIDSFITTLKSHQTIIFNDHASNKTIYESILQQCHFTVSQQHQLKLLINNIINLSSSIDIEAKTKTLRSAKTIINELQNIHQSLSINLK